MPKLPVKVFTSQTRNIPIDQPNLAEIQFNSYDWFKGKGLKELFQEILPIKDFSGKEFIDAHGTYGQIVKVTSSTLIVKGRDNVEKIVVVNDDTSIMRLRGVIKISGLKINDNIIVIGEPNEQGQIEAKFIRFLPATSNLPVMDRR